jgi:hypothetical protein
MKRLPFVAGLLLAFLSVSTTAQAAYLSNKDISLNVNLPVNLVLGGTLAATTFDTQEQAHALVTDTTGQEVDHFYIWVNVNGQPVAAVDPLCTYDFGKR